MENTFDQYQDWHTRGLEGWLRGYKASTRWARRDAPQAPVRLMLAELLEATRPEARGFAAGLKSALGA